MWLSWSIFLNKFDHITAFVGKQNDIPEEHSRLLPIQCVPLKPLATTLIRVKHPRNIKHALSKLWTWLIFHVYFSKFINSQLFFCYFTQFEGICCHSSSSLSEAKFLRNVGWNINFYQFLNPFRMYRQKFPITLNKPVPDFLNFTSDLQDWLTICCICELKFTKSSVVWMLAHWISLTTLFSFFFI